ncbi:MAG: S8 family serine peptidase [candidate division Zixibacteria bacterium]|nr:S8 family serine peptidase [candidate division Zixibacteria bacterium]
MRLMVTFLLMLCLILSASIVFGSNTSVKSNSIPIKGQYIIRFADDVNLDVVSKGFGMFRLGIPSIEQVLDNFEAEEVRPVFPNSVNKANDLSRFYLVRISKEKNEQQFVESLKSNPNILSVEQDIACRIDAETNDPSRSSQWYIYQISRADIHAHEAWDIEPGSDTVIIAIMDTGVNYKHSDLENNIWINPGEDIDGDMVVFDSTDFNNVDDDLNGYYDDVIGFDFFNGGGVPAWPGEDGGAKDRDPSDFNGHGTHVAGIAAAVSNNGVGVAGVCGGWGKLYSERGAQIMCLRVGYSAVDPDDGHEAGLVIMSAVAEAINYAVDNGADVINFSAGSSFTSSLLSALNSAMSAGMVFTYSAGNDGVDNPDYMATFNGVIAVASSDSDDGKSSFSNYGTWVDVTAPGGAIYNTYSNHYTATYETLWGTSMSAPVVAGIAGLIKSHRPDFDKDEIDTLIINNADPMTSDPHYNSGQLGSGRVNVYNSLAAFPSARFNSDVRYGSPPFTVNFTDASISATSWDWDFGDGGISSDQNPSYEYTTPGYHTVTLTIDGAIGTHTRVKKSYVYVTADTLYAPAQTIPVGSDLVVEWSLKNSVPLDEFVLPFIYPATGSPTLILDSFSVAGTRAENFDAVTKPAESTNKVVLVFKAATTSAKDALPPGDGPIVKLYFSTSGGGALEVNTTTFGSSYSLLLENRFSQFAPTVVPASVNITYYARGDANGDSQVNVGDAVHIINYVFRGGWPPIDYPQIYAGDANADLNVNVGDAVYIINYVFRGGPPPPP